MSRFKELEDPIEIIKYAVDFIEHEGQLRPSEREVFDEWVKQFEEDDNEK